MPRPLRLCSRGPGRMFLGGGRNTTSHRHCTWSSKGTTTFVNFGFLWTNSILFTYLQEEGKKKISIAMAPTLQNLSVSVHFTPGFLPKGSEGSLQSPVRTQTQGWCVWEIILNVRDNSEHGSRADPDQASLDVSGWLP